MTLYTVSISTKCYTSLFLTTIDFILDLPLSKLESYIYDLILIVTDRYTKVSRYLLTTKTLNVVGLVNNLHHEIFQKYSWPEGMISDRGAVITSTL